MPEPSSAERSATAVIVLGRGGYGERAADELAGIVGALADTSEFLDVVSAFVDQGTPGIVHALNSVVSRGASRVIVQPAFMPGDEGLHSWIAKRLRRWLRAHGANSVEIVLAPSLADIPELHDAVLASVRAQGTAPSIWVNAGVDRGDPSWSRIPPHSKHVLVCRGPRCTERGADEVAKQLHHRLAETGLDRGSNQALTATTGCLYPCNLGPMMIVYPDAVWYCAVTPDVVDQIVDQHFLAGEIQEQWARYPGPKPIPRPLAGLPARIESES